MEGKAEISYKDLRLVCSGTFLTFGEGETRVTLTVEGDLIHTIFDFKSGDTLPPKPNVDAKVEGTDTIRFTLVDYVNPLGTGVHPINIGTIAEHPLWLVFKVKGFADWPNSKEVTYSFYLGPETADQPSGEASHA